MTVILRHLQDVSQLIDICSFLAHEFLGAHAVEFTNPCHLLLKIMQSIFMKTILITLLFSVHSLQALEVSDVIEMEKAFYESLDDLCIKANVHVTTLEKPLAGSQFPESQSVISHGAPKCDWTYELWVEYPKFALVEGDADYVEFGGYGFAGVYEPSSSQIHIFDSKTVLVISDLRKKNNHFFGGHSFSAFLGKLDAVEVSLSGNSLILSRTSDVAGVIVEVERSMPFRILNVNHINFRTGITTETIFSYTKNDVGFPLHALIPAEVNIQQRAANDVVFVDKQITFERADCELIRDPIAGNGLREVFDYRLGSPVNYHTYNIIPNVDILVHLAKDEVFREAFSKAAVRESQK